MINKQYIDEQRVKAWIYLGVEVELELCELDAENRFLYTETPIRHEDIDWNNKKIATLQSKLILVNTKIERFSGVDTREVQEV